MDFDYLGLRRVYRYTPVSNDTDTVHLRQKPSRSWRRFCTVWSSRYHRKNTLARRNRGDKHTGNRVQMYHRFHIAMLSRHNVS